jgi:hypothetical protein
MDASRAGMTHAELLDLPTTVDLETGNRAFGLGRSLGYTLAREGRYPCRVIKAGTAYRVVTADLRRVLGAPELTEQPA